MTWQALRPARRTGLGLLCAAALFAGAPAGHAQGKARETITLVLDGSSSMWAKMEDGEARLDAMKKAVSQLAEKTGDARRFRTVDFGYRSRNSCNDLSVAGTPEAIGRTGVSTVLKKLRNPKGRSLVDGALRRAVSIAAPNGTVIMMVDGRDRCGRNACASAAALKRDNPAVTVHTLGLNIRDKETASISCIAEAFGGEALNLKTGKAVATALARLSNVGAAASLAVAQDSDKPGVQLRIRLGGESAPIETGALWVFTPDGGGKPSRSVVQRADLQNVALAPGRYRVDVTYRGLLRSMTADVSSDPAKPVAVSLDGGLIEVDVPKGGTAMGLVLQPAATNAATRVSALTASAQFAVDAGQYTLNARSGGQDITETITIKAGETRRWAPFADAVPVRLTAIAANGGPSLDGVVFDVTEVDLERQSGAKTIAQIAGGSARLLLQPGIYQVDVSLGDARARSRLVVRPGKPIDQSLLLPVGRAVIGAKLAAADTPIKTDVRFDVRERDSAAGAPLVTTSEPRPEVDLPPGTYTISAHVGQANATARREVEIVAGKRLEVPMVIRAGRTRIALAPDALRAGERLLPVWEIRDAGNAVVHSTAALVARPILAIGRYTATARLGQRTVSKSFAVSQSGVTKVVVGGAQ